MIEDHWVQGNADFPMAQGGPGRNAAPTVCAPGGRYNREHGEFHIVQGLREESYMPGGANAGRPWDYGAGRGSAIMAHNMTFEDSECSPQCLGAQLDNFYGEDQDRPLNTPSRQNLAVNDTQNDGRWLRANAENQLGGALGRP
jgi:hypothetical protein